MSARFVLLLQSGDPERLAEAAAMVAAAVSLGTDVTLVWLSGAADALLSGRLEEQPAGNLFAEARESGRVRSLACSAALAKNRRSQEELRALVDEVVGWPTVVSLLKSAEKSFVW